jgi:hypothetical protein
MDQPTTTSIALSAPPQLASVVNRVTTSTICNTLDKPTTTDPLAGKLDDLIPICSDAGKVQDPSAAHVGKALEKSNKVVKSGVHLTSAHHCLTRARKFLLLFADGGVETYAARAVGWTAGSVRDLRARSPAFATAYTQAQEAFADRMEREMIRQATVGDTERHYDRDGKLIHERPLRSWQLLSRILEAHKPALYGRTPSTVSAVQVQLSINVSGVDHSQTCENPSSQPRPRSAPPAPLDVESDQVADV